MFFFLCVLQHFPRSAWSLSAGFRSPQALRDQQQLNCGPALMLLWGPSCQQKSLATASLPDKDKHDVSREYIMYGFIGPVALPYDVRLRLLRVTHARTVWD